MNFGTKIDDSYLHAMPEYKDKVITAKDRSKVALDQKDKHANEAQKRIEELKSNYGNGVSTLCRFYNASGDQITVHINHSFRGHLYSDSPALTVENGQWTTFLHVHTSGAAKGSCGAVVYRTAQDTDIFIGWQSPWNASDPTCYTDSREKDYWWDKSWQGTTLGLLDYAGNQKIAEGFGYKVTVSIGCSKSPNCIAVIEKV